MTDNEREKIILDFNDSIPEDATFEDLVDSIIRITDEEKKSIVSMNYCDNVIDDLFFHYGWSYPTNIRLSDEFLLKRSSNRCIF